MQAMATIAIVAPKASTKPRLLDTTTHPAGPSNGVGLGALGDTIMGKILQAANRLLSAHRVGCQVCNSGRVCAFVRGIADAQRKAVSEQVFGVASGK